MKPCRPHHGDFSPDCPVCVRARKSEADARRMGEPWPPPDIPDGYVYQPPPPRSVPVDEWPVWAKKIAGWKQDGDAGVGDTFARKLGVLGETFKAVMKSLGIDCGCEFRQEEWNRLYPYPRE